MAIHKVWSDLTDPNRRYIDTDKGLYIDKLISHSVKKEREQALAVHHGRAVVHETTRVGRRWRFHLRNNAAKRARMWS